MKGRSVEFGAIGFYPPVFTNPGFGRHLGDRFERTGGGYERKFNPSGRDLALW